MDMRHRKRAQVARALTAWAPPGEAEIAVLATLTQVRQARLALLRNPRALADIKGQIKRMDKGTAGVLRKMLAEDLKLMRRIDRAPKTISQLNA